MMKCVVVTISLVQISIVLHTVMNRNPSHCRRWLSPDPSLIRPCHHLQAVWINRWRVEQSDLTTSCLQYTDLVIYLKIFDKLESDLWTECLFVPVMCWAQPWSTVFRFILVRGSALCGSLGPVHMDYWERCLKSTILTWNANIKVATPATFIIAWWGLVLPTLPGKPGVVQTWVLSPTSKIGLGCGHEELLVSEPFLAL